MIQVQLKAKHYYFIANDLKNLAAYQYFGLLNRIKDATVDKKDDELVTVDCSVDDLVYVFRMLSEKKEGEANMMNTDMMQVLMPQAQAGATAGNQLWIEAATKISEVRNANWAITDQAIVNGKTFLHNDNV